MEAATLTRALIVLGLLAGCATPPVPDCPASVPAPAPLVGKPTAAKIGALEIRVELWGEAERDRGDCWRDAFERTKK